MGTVEIELSSAKLGNVGWNLILHSRGKRCRASNMATLGLFPFFAKPFLALLCKHGFVDIFPILCIFPFFMKWNLWGREGCQHFLPFQPEPRHMQYHIFKSKKCFWNDSLAQNFVLFSLSLSFFSCFHFQKTISPSSPQRLAKSIKYPKQVLFNFLKGFFRVGRRETRLKCVIERKCNKGGRVTTIALSGLTELF